MDKQGNAATWEHMRGSPWWFAATPDGGFHVGICEHRSGLYRIYTASRKDDIQVGNGHLEATETSLKAAKADGAYRISQVCAGGAL